MRNWAQHAAFAIFMSGSLAPGVTRAESIEEAKQEDVAMLLDAASGRNSAYSASLIGETRGRVYIEYETGVYASSFLSKGSKRVVYWLPRSEITDEQMAQLKAYKDGFALIESFRPGMTQGEAAAAIASFGPEGRSVVSRPAAGWVERDGTAGNIQGRAFTVEGTHRQVLVAESYPVRQAPFGPGTLYLFYGSDGGLLVHYWYPEAIAK